MGYTITRARECGTRYTAYYRDIRGKIRSAGTFTTERKADRAWQAAEAAQAVGRVNDPRRGRQRFRVYASEVWFPNHLLERSTRQNYTYLYDRYIAPFFGDLKMVEIMPSDVREWVVTLQTDGVRPPTIKQCKVILDAILTTALNDQITFLHAGKGVRTPAVAKKVRRIITTQQFDRLVEAVRDETMRLLIETGIESGMRWGELSELRPADLDPATGVFTVRRAVVELNPKFHPNGERFLVKDYPKDSEWREIKISSRLLQTLNAYISERGLGVDDLLFTYDGGAAQRVAVPPSTIASGVTEPKEHGRTYRHGTKSAYTAGKCRCEHCRKAMADYRAARRAAGLDSPRKSRTVDTDGHISADWFRDAVWKPAVQAADLRARITPHSLRHAHASWLLAGGAQLQAVRERMGHGSITTTEIYLHSLPGAGDEAVAAFERFRGRHPA